MRKNKYLHDIAKSGRLIGDDRASVRVTIEPAWQLKTTNPAYANTIRGPYRYHVDAADTRLEVEIPQIKTVTIDRSLSQDVATCKISLYNQSHNKNSIVPELGNQLGRPGSFWPKRGDSEESELLWNQTPARGARYRNGTWDADFLWSNVIIPNGLIRTYTGNARGTAAIDEDLANSKIEPSGVWLIDRVTGGTDGSLMIECRDVGRLLLEQIIYPPLVPYDLYPLAYYPPGRSAFDSSFGAKPVTGVGLASIAEVRLLYQSSSFGNGSISGHYASEAADMNRTNWSWGPARAEPTFTDPYDWWQFTMYGGGAQVIDAVDFRPWAGGYMAYISVWDGSQFLGSSVIPDGSGIKYLKAIQVPYAIPDGFERELHVQLDAAVTGTIVRVTLGPSYHYSAVGESGKYYRCGLRTVIGQRTGARVPSIVSDWNEQFWSYGMASHPVRGYWVVDTQGWVYGFGDAADYDSSTYGQVPLAYSPGAGIQDDGLIHAYGNTQNGAARGNNIHQVTDIAAHPSGRGYWTLSNDGSVFAFGEATYYGSRYVGPNIFNNGPVAVAIASTYTGNGYWVAYSDGVINGYGDATPSYTVLPYTALTNYMVNYGPEYKYLYPDNNPLGFIVKTAPPSAYAQWYRCRGLAAHPTKMGFWAVDGSGQVFSYGTEFYGELTNRRFNPGAANQFYLWPKEYATSIEATANGDGYWISFLSGHVAAFGEATKSGTTYVYEGNSLIANMPTDGSDLNLFRIMTQQVCRDPDGSGFWVLVSDGSVLKYDAEWWGQPGWANRINYRWHDGNLKDYVYAIYDWLAWSGFTYYKSTDPNGTTSLTGHDRPPVLGNLESTGIPTTTILEGEKWDKRSVMDCINELKQVCAYNFYIDEEGLPHFESHNIWKAGNFDSYGQRIFVKYEEDGSWDFVDESDPDAEPFIPEVHEANDLINYQASLDGESLRSEIIIGSDLPDANDPTKTKFVRFKPPSASEEVMPGVPSLRNIQRPAAWVNTNFENDTENLLMAELIALRIWFSQRTGTATIVGNANIGLGDQVRFVERNTSETFIHVVNAISSTIDLDTGQHTMQLNTNWLGDANDWVITSSNTYNPITHVSVSERVDRWQLALEKGLTFHGDGTSHPTLNGGFN